MQACQETMPSRREYRTVSGTRIGERASSRRVTSSTSSEPLPKNRATVVWVGPETGEPRASYPSRRR